MKNILAILLPTLFLLGCQNHYENKYYVGGQLKSRHRISDGVYSGDFWTYYPNGQIKSKGFWKNGSGNGFIERYFLNGVLEEKSNWLNGRLHGRAEVFDSLGNIVLRSDYSEGNPVGEYVVFFNSGNVSEIHLFDDESNLYYLVKYSNTGSKILEIFYPVCTVSRHRDSLLIKVQVKVGFSGKASLLMGRSNLKEFERLLNPIELRDTLPKTIRLPGNLNESELFLGSYIFHLLVIQCLVLNWERRC